MLLMYFRYAGHNAVNLSVGKHTPPSGVFNSNLWTLRKYDALGKRMPLAYIGQVSGSPDVVIVSKPMLTNEIVLRHMIVLAIVAFSKQAFETNVHQCFVEAAIQLIGLCGDNMNSSPCVALTDCSSHYFLFSLVLDQKRPQLKYSISIKRCADLQSMMHLAKCEGNACRSADFGRPATPHEIFG
jgi:hypothetical protein